MHKHMHTCPSAELALSLPELWGEASHWSPGGRRVTKARDAPACCTLCPGCPVLVQEAGGGLALPGAPCIQVSTRGRPVVPAQATKKELCLEV